MEKGGKVATLAIGVNLVMFGIKYFFAGVSGSIALKADADHSLSDVVAGHIIASRIEAAIGKEIRNVDRVLLHYEPTRKETFVYAIPCRRSGRGNYRTISARPLSSGFLLSG